MNKLLKVDRNGSKHWEGVVKCDRCSGTGIFAIGVRNGQLVASPVDAGVCWKCGGSGQVVSRWVERTPEYQAKLDARRKAKSDAREKEFREEEEKRAAERKELEEKIKAEKAVSKYIGSVGDKLVMKVEFLRSASFDTYYGTTFIHTFKDEHGNKIIWKTSKALGTDEDGEWRKIEVGQVITLQGTVKEHSEYRDEKQTALTRCKITEIGE